MRNKDIIFGTRPVLETIKSNKNIERIFIQKNTNKDIIEEIKTLGKFKVKISLHSEVDATITINVLSAETIQ